MSKIAHYRHSCKTHRFSLRKIKMTKKLTAKFYINIFLFIIIIYYPNPNYNAHSNFLLLTLYHPQKGSIKDQYKKVSAWAWINFLLLKFDFPFFRDNFCSFCHTAAYQFWWVLSYALKNLGLTYMSDSEVKPITLTLPEENLTSRENIMFERVNCSRNKLKQDTPTKAWYSRSIIIETMTCLFTMIWHIFIYLPNHGLSFYLS